MPASTYRVNKESLTVCVPTRSSKSAEHLTGEEHLSGDTVLVATALAMTLWAAGDVAGMELYHFLGNENCDCLIQKCCENDLTSKPLGMFLTEPALASMVWEIRAPGAERAPGP